MSWTRDEWARIERPWAIVEHDMERGSLAAVRRLHSNPGLREVVNERHPDAMRFWASVDTWIAEAERHEEIHGAGSRLVPDHPFNVEMARLRRVEEAQARWRAQFLSAHANDGFSIVRAERLRVVQ